MNVSRIFWLPLIIAFIFSSLIVNGQDDRTSLEKKKKENLAKIQEAEKILKETANLKRNSLGQLRALNQQIVSQEALIRVYQSNIRLLEADIKENTNLSNSLEKDLAQLKEEYANMVYQAEKTRNSYGSLTFLFSASSFSELIMRAKYLQQYTAAREDQAREIDQVQKQLAVQLAEINSRKQEQEQLLGEQRKQNQSLLAAKSQKNTVVKQLSLREKDLKDDLKKRKRSIQRLDRMIADLIRKEIEANKKKEEGYELTPEGALLSSNFQGNQKRLSWPVAKGFVSSKFGLQPHPVLKGVKIENPGVDIQTQKNEVVRAVFDGEVSKIASIPGMNGVVIIIQHGEYRTVYANLSKALVKTGDRVSTKDPIGEVFTDNNGVSEVQFQVWKSFNKLDPLAWLQPK